MSTYTRFPGPMSLGTVDIIPMFHNLAEDTDHALLGRKPSDPKGLWRFIGGFADPGDPSYEHSAVRELSEETSGTVLVEIDELIYLGSSIVNDPRMDGQDKIKTMLFMADLGFGDTLPEVR